MHSFPVLVFKDLDLASDIVTQLLYATRQDVDKMPGKTAAARGKQSAQSRDVASLQSIACALRLLETAVA